MEVSKSTVVKVFIGASLLYYILAPTVKEYFNLSPKPMFTKRPDKFTTGLINLRNDCFANSSIQAYSSLPGLTEYLNEFITAFKKIETFLINNGIDRDFEDFETLSGSSKVTDDSDSPPPSTSTNPKFKKMEMEFNIPLHISLAKIIKKLQSTQMTSRTISVWTFLHDLEKIFNAKISRSQHDAQELTQLINETLEHENLKIIRKFNFLKKINKKVIHEGIEIPEFPLNGLILNQMKCINCRGLSKPNFSPFLMLTLHTPESVSTDLETLLNENESEQIDDYQCLRCKIKKLINHEKSLNGLDRQRQLDSKYSPEEIDYLAQLNDFNDNENSFINEDLPKDLENYIKDYKKIDISVKSTVLRKNQILKPPKIFGLHLSRSSFNGFNVVRNSCRVSFRDHLNLSIGKEYLEELKNFKQMAFKDIDDSKVLTNDVNDMEDDDVQDEKLEVQGDINQVEDVEDVEDEELDEEDDDDSSVDTVKKQETLNKSPITTDQTDDLVNHFKSFNFNENDNYKYRLKAMIRHQGSHTQGHYECYKRKPLFVKDSEGMIIKLSPEISDDVIEDSVFDKSRSLSSSSERSTDEEIESGSFRRRFSNMVNRKPSVFQADPEIITNEIIPDGLNTPAEFQIDKENDYFNLDQVNKKINKFKKISSVLKHPYWRISDSMITEVTKAAVLVETTSVYMLYYEREESKVSTA